MPYATSTTTYKDLVDHVIDFLGAGGQNAEVRDAKRSVQSAYRDLTNAARWSYYYQRGRITSVAQYNTGTIQYTHTGGSFERQVTLTTGTWPTWAAFGTLVIDNIPYEIATRESNSIVTLSTNSNPGANVAAGASFTLYRDTYPMPVDFLAADEIINLNNVRALEYVRPSLWLTQQRNSYTPGQPWSYTFMPDPNYVGQMAVRFFPAPDNVYSFDFIYQRRPRPLLTDSYTTGTVSVTNGSVIVTGVGTTFTSRMVGSILRVTSSTTIVPTGLAGSNPYTYERVISSFTSATSITVDEVYPETLTGVKYIISDPADIDEGVMLTALLRGCEHQVARSRSLKERQEITGAYYQALVLAKEADSRSFARRSSGHSAAYRVRTANMPITFPEL